MNQLRDKIKAGFPGIALLTCEEMRAESVIFEVAQELEYNLHAWSISSGRLDVMHNELFEEDALGVLDAVAGLSAKSLLILRDYHRFLIEPDAITVRKLRDALQAPTTKLQNKTIIFLGPELKLPPEIEKLVTVMELPMPDRDGLQSVVARLCQENEYTMPEGIEMSQILDALTGLTTSEAEDALSLARIETETFDPVVISREKANVVKKNGLLELIESHVRPSDIGGLENILEDLHSKRNSFTQAARDYGLPSPRGYFVVGQPGTGKSLTAQATGGIFKVPLVKIEAGSIFGGLVGESERNWRTAFATARAIAPCVFWMDEADGLFNGGGKGSNDGGTTQRVVKAILQDMQFHAEGIFFILTANDIDGVPDPLIDRLDVWSVDLPTQTERETIWRIHIAKRGRNPDDYSLPELAKATEGFSGRQIEQVWIKAMEIAFDDNAREPVMGDALTARTKFTATSVTMADAIEARRRRLTGKATPASKPDKPPAPAPTTRRLAAGGSKRTAVTV